MKLFRTTYKVIALKLLSIIGVVLMAAFSSRKDKENPTAKQKAIRKWWLKKVVHIVGLNLHVTGELPNKDESSLWVSNHVSWMDIPIIGSMGVGFLSKSEVRRWPVIGWLGAKGGTVFIDRGGKNASQIASTQIAKRILSGDNILVFPEATTTNGTHVKKFHARIFAPAMDHKLLVQPIAIQYLNKEGHTHPSVMWENQSFMSNLVGILGQTDIHVVLTFLPVLDTKDFSARRQIADVAEKQIRAVVNPAEVN